ncbi:TetR/AcrR family transcriptional regulator [Antribacter gilvus]|uniref:TetR/AcrR family transcriptional regulator n=1 Tax=Antribacter gilvus TaxID=2304675 RepID=UPI000F7797E1|nr:helix-turn-helix domain-containing protein [Antribacter gilvus]
MSTENPGALPTSLQRLWEGTTPGRRGPKPALSAERIVEAAIELADEDGLAAVSMARVGKRLGFSPMALYRHVRDKEELLVLLSDAAAGDPPPIDPAVGWRRGLEIWTRAQIDGVLERPWLLELPLSSTPFGPGRVRWLDRAFEVMRPLDIPTDDKLGIAGLLAQHVLGEARVQVESRRAAADRVRRETGAAPGTPESDLDPAALAAADPYTDFEIVLQRYIGPDTYPSLFEAMSAWEPEAPGAGVTTSDEIDFGIMVILDGVEAYIARRRRG